MFYFSRQNSTDIKTKPFIFMNLFYVRTYVLCRKHKYTHIYIINTQLFLYWIVCITNFKFNKNFKTEHFYPVCNWILSIFMIQWKIKSNRLSIYPFASEFCFRRLRTYSPGLGPMVYRLIDAELIWIFVWWSLHILKQNFGQMKSIHYSTLGVNGI